MEIRNYIEVVAGIVESIGVLAILFGTVLSLYRYIFRRKYTNNAYGTLRKELGKAILLGLEILVAADIIATVVTEPEIDRVLALGLIVLIRTFLSLSLQVEIEGKFPWKKKTTEDFHD